MAYMKKLKTQCSQQPCYKEATVEVFNTRNGSMGKYCTPHGNRKLKETQAYEDAKYSQQLPQEGVS